MSRIKCFNCREYGHFACDCPKARDTTNIARESEQKGKSESMLDLESTSVNEECAMVCIELQYEDVSKDEVVYSDQGISKEEYEKAVYGDFPKTKSEEEDKDKCTVAQRANDSMILEMKRRGLNENNPDKKSDDDNQSDRPISEKSTINSINKSTLVAQGPADHDDKNESRKVWTMEMLTNDSDISTNTLNEEESVSDDEKMFLYARAVHSNHLIQYHTHQIMERQRVVNEYKNMTVEGMNLIPQESILHKYYLVIISQTINMIESDIFWYHNKFESVMSDIQNMWTEGIRELENTHSHCTNNDENNNEMVGVEVIDLCSASQSKNDVFCEGKESEKQESQDKSKHDAAEKIEMESRTIRSKSMTKNEKVESEMMCWESTRNFTEEEPHKEPEKVAKKPIKKMEKQKHEEEHVNTTLYISIRLKISIEEFSWEREDNGSTLETEEPKQQEIVYITNLNDCLRKDSTKLYHEEGPNEKTLLREIVLLKSPP